MSSAHKGNRWMRLRGHTFRSKAASLTPRGELLTLPTLSTYGLGVTHTGMV
jgi:hypothetical protein